MASLETARRKSPTDVTSSLSCSHCPVLIDWLLRSAGPKPPLEHSYQPPTTSVICKSSACGAARLRAVGYDSKSSVAKLIATSYQLPATSYQSLHLGCRPACFRTSGSLGRQCPCMSDDIAATVVIQWTA